MLHGAALSGNLGTGVYTVGLRPYCSAGIMIKQLAVALITGAANNIGRAAAQAFAEDHIVVLADIEDATEAAQEIGQDAVAVQGDVSDAADCARWIKAAEEHGPLRGIVHAAGITRPPQTVEEISPAEWDEVIRVNLTGSFLLAQAAIPALRRAGDAAVVFISSRAGKSGFTIAGLTGGRAAAKAHYAASKAGLISLTKSLAMELAADGIRVNCIAPGPIEGTMIPRQSWPQVAEQVPLGRLGRPDEIAAAAWFLCSADAAFTTGHILDVNGGVLMD